MKNIGAKVRVYCSVCHTYMNGVLLDFDESSCVPYTVATYGHYLPGGIKVESVNEIEFVDWEDAYEFEKKK